jgi:hypothetical protein
MGFRACCPHADEWLTMAARLPPLRPSGRWVRRGSVAAKGARGPRARWASSLSLWDAPATQGAVGAAGGLSPQPRAETQIDPWHVANARGHFRTLLSCLEPHDRIGRQPVDGLARARRIRIEGSARIARVLQSGHSRYDVIYYVWKITDNLGREEDYFDRPRHEGIKMSTIRRPANYAGLLPVTPSDEPPILSTTLENDRPNGQQSLRKRASHALSRFLIAFCIGVAASLAWQSYGDTARKIIANSYPQALAPQAELVAQKAPEAVTLAASPGHQQFDAMARDLHAIQQSVEQIAASQERITRTISQIATGIVAGQERTTRNTDQTTSGAPPSSTNPSSITVESQADGASVQPAVRSDTKPTMAKPPQTPSERGPLQTLSERGKQLSARGGHDGSCFPSAWAALQQRPGGWPSWTMRAPGHEGTLCWYAATRPRTSNHRRELMPGEKEIVGTENAVSAPPASYTRAPE